VSKLVTMSLAGAASARWRRCCTAAVIAPLMFGSLPAAADARSDWQTPFDIVLPEAARTILLKPGADAGELAQALGLTQFRVLARGRQGSMLETRLNEADWQRVQQAACAGSAFADAVEACETAACQTIQLQGVATPGSGQRPDTLEARLVRNPPEMVPMPAAADPEAGSCSGPPLIPPLAEAGSGDLTLAVRMPGGSADDSAAPARVDGARRSFEFGLDSRFDPRGGVQLGTDVLPDDTSDWSLVAGAGCSEVSVPLDSLAPARAPGTVLALIVSSTAAAVAASYNLQLVREITLGTTGERLAVFAGAADMGQMLALLAADGRVSGAQPEFIYRTSAAPGKAQGAGGGHSDPFAWLNYGPEKTGASRLHTELQGEGQLVAVIDTGIALEHPELAARIREHVDLTGRGWSTDAHGTAVAGVIAADADNGLGSYGVAPQVQILALKACQPKEGGLEARCWTSTLVQALDLAMARDAGIINMSLAGPPDDLLARYVGLATQQNRVVVAAAGNGGPNAKPGFPAALPGVLAVTAVDAGDALYPMANVGAYIDVAAPGVDIVSPAPDGSYPPLSGTSLAAAHASGVVALLRELMPMMSSMEVIAAVSGNVADLGAAGADDRYGAGLIDACAAAETISAAAIVCPAAAPQLPDGPAAAPGETGLETGTDDELVIELQ